MESNLSDNLNYDRSNVVKIDFRFEENGIAQKSNGNWKIRGTAEVYGVQQKQVRYCRARLQQLIGKLAING